jgi:hypothetical protein
LQQVGCGDTGSERSLPASPTADQTRGESSIRP